MKNAKSKSRKAAYHHVEKVEVYLWDTFLGVVVLDPAYGFYAFRYTSEFKSTGWQPSPLTMPTDIDMTFLFTDLPELTYKRLPAMLSDALPDDFGNALVNRYMADKGVPANQITSLDRLAYMGNRSMGALTFKPSKGPTKHTLTAVELSKLVGEARKAVHGEIDNDDHASAALRSIIEVGTSAGGARAKAVIAWNPDTEAIVSGQMDAPDGFEHWLLKFDGIGTDSALGASQDYGRIEFAYHLMARYAGINMMDSRLLHENGRSHFMTKRFDRDKGNVRHHIQTLCAMNHIDYKKIGTNSYSQLFATISDLALPYEDMEEAFRRMVFNVMARNCDDHTKNISFRLKKGHAWELAPAYDIIFAHNPDSQWTQQHLMSVNGKFKDISVNDMLIEAERFGIGTAQQVIDEVRNSVLRWSDFASEAGVSAEQTKHILNHLNVV
jgi:serine/threonine-protein kinase HipA